MAIEASSIGLAEHRLDALAIDAVHRAAPFGSMQHLPHPWKWAEIFLFDDERRFKPRELDR